MSGGLASPAARRLAAPESASRSRPESATRMPVRQPPAALSGRRPQVPSTRERMQASFAAGSPTAGREAIRMVGPVEGAPVERAPAAAPAAEALTTRERIVNRALAAPEAAPSADAPASAVVVDLAEIRDRRRPQRSDATTTPAGPTALAPVIALAPRPPAAMPGARGSARRGDVVASPTPARAGPEAAPAGITATSSPTSKLDPEASGAPARAGPEAAPKADAASEPGASAEAGAAPATAAPESTSAAGAAPESSEGGSASPTAGPDAAPVASSQAAAAPQPETAGAPTPAAAPAAASAVIRNPEDEPSFQAMKVRARLAGRRAKDHQPGTEGAATAQGASAPDPQRDVDSQAADVQVAEMGAQEPGPFDPAAFKRDVKKAVEGMAPPATLEEADEFEESGKAGQATTAIQGLVTGGRADSERDIKVSTEAAPDPSGKVPKPVTEMVNDAPGPPLPDIGAAAALPGPRPQEQVDLSGGPQQVDAKMAEANVTEEQLASANEPDFSAAPNARQEVCEHAAADPAAYRSHEELVLATGRTEAESVAATQLEDMHGARTATLGGVLGAKDATKLADQQLRDDVHQSILGIHERTQADVKTLLATLDTTVDTIFTEGEKAARKHFEEYVDQKMRAYKAARYGGWGGGLLWAKDKWFDLPDKVNDFYRDGRADYLKAMDGVIDAIAVSVGVLLGAAQLRIQAGREEVQTFVTGLPISVRKLGEETAGGLDGRFDQLSSDVDAKRDELVDTVARKYVESRDELDTRITELQEANKGFVSRAIDAVVGVIKTIYELGKLLLGVLLKAASAIGDIIAHPIRFLGSLIDAVKGGLDRFVSRIGVHLQESLLDLLLGELGSAGITMPKQLDFAGILDLVLQVLGLTYKNVRERVVKRFGEPVVARMEQTVDVFKTLVKDGVAGLWTWIREKLADLSDLVVGKIKEYIVDRVVKAGIGYVVALLNPAAAFIKACQGIYQIVMFIVERAKQIAQFVDAILDSIGAIAQGNVGAAVEKIESALARGLTLAIAFLARLANLGAISEKVRSIIAAVRKPITRAVDGIVFGAAEIFRRTLGPALAFGQAKVQSGRDWAKSKVQTGKAWAMHKAQSVDVRVTHRDLVHERSGETDPQPHTDDELAQPAGDGQWIYEYPEGGHTIRITPSLEVFQFSAATKLAGPQAQAQKQKALEREVPRTELTYPTDGLDRASGPAGFVKSVKDGEARASMPPVSNLPGGIAAYEPGDVRGHLIGDRFNGPATGGNLVPMHTTLNGSSFLSYETQLANACKAAKTTGGAAMLRMAITPRYPADNPAMPGAKFRPGSVTASSTVFSLSAAGGTLTAAEQAFPASFDNPSNAVVVINLNTASKQAILAAYSGTLSPDVHRLVDAILAVRPRRSADGFAFALALKLPVYKIDLFGAMLDSRGARFVIA